MEAGINGWTNLRVTWVVGNKLEWRAVFGAGSLHQGARAFLQATGRFLGFLSPVEMQSQFQQQLLPVNFLFPDNVLFSHTAVSDIPHALHDHAYPENILG